MTDSDWFFFFLGGFSSLLILGFVMAMSDAMRSKI